MTRVSRRTESAQHGSSQGFSCDVFYFSLCSVTKYFYTEGDSDEAIIAKLGGAVRLKKAALGGNASANEIASNSSSNRPMILIGG